MTRFPFFSAPADGESVYSGFCRSATRFPVFPTQLLLGLTEQRYLTALIGSLPGLLKFIAQHLPYGHPWTDTDYTIRYHTALPYYVYFRSPAQRAEAIERLSNSSFIGSVNAFLGLSQDHSRDAIQGVRWCPECAREDEITWGFPYFHREHQLPAVALCWRHGCALSRGCRVCGRYPIRGRSLAMPGRCRCADGADPLAISEVLPGNPAALRWMAGESAYMVQSRFSGFENSRSVLRILYESAGYYRGCLPMYTKIAEAIEDKYGNSLLNWLGYPSFTSGHVSPWIRGVLRPSKDDRGICSIVLLLIMGLVCDSVREFEEIGSIGSPSILSEITHPPAESEDWKKDLARSLESNNFSLCATSAQLEVNSYTVASEAIKQKIRVPLSRRIQEKLGLSELMAIRDELWAGCAKKAIRRRHSLSEWVLLQIMLDSVGIADENRTAAADDVRDFHRRVVLELKESIKGASKSTVLMNRRGTYDFMLRRDREWFNSQFIESSGVASTPHKQRVRNWLEIDNGMALEIFAVARDMRAKDGKPVWISHTAVLRRCRALSRFSRCKQNLPKAQSALTEVAESHTAFLKRKIEWALRAIGESGRAISMNLLRRKASTTPEALRYLRLYVAEVAARMGIEIDKRSMFFVHLTRAAASN